MAEQTCPYYLPKDYNRRIAIVGEFPVAADISYGRPFASTGGRFLRQLLAQAEIALDDCFCTNLFNSPAPANDILNWCAAKGEVQAAWEVEHEWVKLPKLTKKEEKALQAAGQEAPVQQPKPIYPYNVYKAPGKYFRHNVISPALTRLSTDLTTHRPNVIIALGTAAAWALLGGGAISALRGTICESTLIPGVKVIPTLHPINVLKDFAQRPILFADLCKAGRESRFAEIRYPKKEIWINPSLTDCWEFYNRHIINSVHPLSVDIECNHSQVTCIGFAPDPLHALVVPFSDSRKPNNCYWPTLDAEQQAWSFVRAVCGNPKPKLLHNGIFDSVFLAKTQKVLVRNMAEDTMLMHHALQPELKKGLGFLASLHLDRAAWKSMRSEAKAKEKSLKADDE